MQIKRLSLFLLILGFALQSLNAGGLKTPLEQNQFSKLSTHSAMMSYLKALDKQSPVFNMTIIGQTVQGRDIPALFFSKDKKFAGNRTQKPVALIFCQQHGNEPSGKEAALMLARYLTGAGKSLLSKLDLILVPQVNPDGGDANTRNNGNKMDLNRNHVILSEPESQALHNLFLDWMPEITLDMHEYNAIKKDWIEHGYVKDAAEMLGGVTNLNIDPALMTFSRNTIIPAVGARIEADGFNFHRYLVGSPFDDGRVRYSTTNVNDGRQSMGIYNTLSFIIEGKRYGDVLNKIELRTRAQLAAQKAFLEVMAQNAAEILKLVQESRAKLLQETPAAFSHIQMDYFEDPEQKSVTFPVFDFSSWKSVQRDLQPFAADVKIQKSVRKPFAYLFSQDETALIALLRKHRIRMHRLSKDAQLPTEYYLILHTTAGINEDKSTLNVDVEKQLTTESLREGDVLVLLKQPASNLIPLLLEPQSTFSICQKRNGHQFSFKNYLTEGQIYPIKRLNREVKLDLTELK